MREVWIACVFAFAALLPAQTDIRKIDFKNFSYPLTGPLLGHNRLIWLATNVKGQVRLRGGGDGEGFTLQSVAYGDLTGEKQDEAIVVLHYSTGGTQQTDYIYIVQASTDGPKVLAYCYTGDRAYFGLDKVYGARGLLVVKLFDPEKRQGDCCSSGIIRTRYRWRDGRFQRVGLPVREDLGKPQ